MRREEEVVVSIDSIENYLEDFGGWEITQLKNEVVIEG